MSFESQGGKTIQLKATLDLRRHITDFGLRALADVWIGRGEQFYRSALLLKREGGDGYVWRHLLATGVEILSKGYLRAMDIRGASDEKLKRKYGHSLLRLVDDAHSAYGMKKPRAPLRREIEQLSNLYEKHTLRYDPGLGLLVDPSVFEVSRVSRRMAAVIRLRRRRRLAGNR